jgi:26S proteasome regulatory subunit N7
MSRVFGVTPAFLDGELSRFIASGRIAAKIDAVAGIIETVRPDPKNAQYAQVLKLGDALLAKTQKLARAAAL